MSDEKAKFVSGLEIGTSVKDKILILGMVDSVSNDDVNFIDRYVLPASMIARLSYTLNNICESLGIDNTKPPENDDEEKK